LVYADDLNILGGIVHTVQRKTGACVVAVKGNGLEVNVDKAEHTIMSPDQNTGRNHSIKIDNKFFLMVEKFKYFETIFQRIKITFRKKLSNPLKSVNACHHSVQNILSLSLLSKNLNISVYRTSIIVSVVLYGCESSSLKLRKDLGSGCVRTGNWREYLGLRGTR
jgi:hypothetical protein